MSEVLHDCPRPGCTGKGQFSGPMAHMTSEVSCGECSLTMRTNEWQSFPRDTDHERAIASLNARIAELEAENIRLRTGFSDYRGQVRFDRAKRDAQWIARVEALADDLEELAVLAKILQGEPTIKAKVTTYETCAAKVRKLVEVKV